MGGKFEIRNSKSEPPGLNGRPRLKIQIYCPKVAILPFMRRQGPITVRHLIVAVLVMVVVNAQLTWWVIFVLRLNRENLNLERQSLLSAARVEAVATRLRASCARRNHAPTKLSTSSAVPAMPRRVRRRRW